jgi:hypothetical protein
VTLIRSHHFSYEIGPCGWLFSSLISTLCHFRQGCISFFFFLEINYYLLAFNFVSHWFQFFFSIHWTSPWSTGLWLVMTLAGMNEGFSLQQISPGLFAFGVKEWQE